MASKKKSNMVNSKQQSAFEFITTYGWAILILAVVIIMLYYFIGIPSTAVPNQCKFVYGTNCLGVVASSANGITKITVVMTNSQNFPIFNPAIKFATDSYGNLSSTCLPAGNIIQPGGEMICNMTMPVYVSPGATITGNTYLNVTACPSGNINNCQPKQVQTYKGSIITRVTSQLQSPPTTSSTTSSTTSTSTSSTSSTSSSSTSSSTSSTSSTTSTTTVSCSPSSQSYTTPGTYTFTTPSGCGPSTVYTISMAGGGGGGAISQLMFCTIQQTAPPYCGFAAGAGGGGGGYEVITASGLAAGTTITVNVGSGGAAYCSGGCSAPSGGDVSYSGGASSVSATNLAASAGGGGGGVEATQLYSTVCSGNPPHASVGGAGGINTYSGSAVTSVVANDIGSMGEDGPSVQCSNPGGAGGTAGGNIGAGGAGGTTSGVAAGSGGIYGGAGGGGAGVSGSLAAGGANGEVIISWN